jgi:hypothetical protein
MQNLLKFSKIGARLHIPSLVGDRTNPSMESQILNGGLRYRVSAKILIEQFRRQLNDVRPHLALALLTPAQFKRTRSIKNLVRAIS